MPATPTGTSPPSQPPIPPFVETGFRMTGSRKLFAWSLMKWKTVSWGRIGSTVPSLFKMACHVRTGVDGVAPELLSEARPVEFAGSMYQLGCFQSGLKKLTPAG